MMHWVENVMASIPEHSKDVRSMLGKLMKSSSLTEVDAHTCALSAALASGNGELAFTIEMFGPLKKNKTEVFLAKNASSLVNMFSMYYGFVDNSGDGDLLTQPDGIECTEAFDSATEEKFTMYCLAAGVVINPNYSITYLRKLKNKFNTKTEVIQDIVKIAAVINTIGKVAPEIDQLVPSGF